MDLKKLSRSKLRGGARLLRPLWIRHCVQRNLPGDALGLLHDPRVDLHEDEVDDVEDEQDQRLVPGEDAVPREPDEAGDGQPVEDAVSD